ncbi:MAG: guanylate kinase [Candidatus Aminicenantes bacterium]|nr:guanylate kinase [Candidatus Aminicenantes bacterium]
MRDIIIVSGPSGCGKSTLARMLLQEFPELRFSVSHTTRPPRDGEAEGREYHFVSEERFQRMVREGRFVEWAEVHGRSYGTSWREVRDKSRAGRPLLLDVDVQGTRAIKREFPEAMAVLVVPPTLAALKKRLRQRQRRLDREARQRLAAALKELRSYRLYDYVIVNDDLASALADLCCLYVAFGRQTAHNAGRVRALLRRGR